MLPICNVINIFTLVYGSTFLLNLKVPEKVFLVKPSKISIFSIDGNL